jgi:hypothetical protein
MTNDPRTRTVGALLVVCLLVAAGCAQKGDTTGSTAPPPKSAGTKDTPATTREATPTPAASASNEPAFRGKAEELHKEFKAGQAAADKKYKGKYVEVEGQVDKVSWATGSKDKLDLAPPQSVTPREMVSCTMSPSAPETYRELGKGQTVKVRGKLTLSIIGTIFLEDCTIADAGPSPVLRAKAKDLGAEFAKEDGEPAAKKYDSKDIFNPKELIVEGVVKDVVITPGRTLASKEDVNLNLDAGMSEPMVCEIEPFEMESAKKIKKGDTVVLRGHFHTNTLALKRYPGLLSAQILKAP